ncbi:hypothetical protein GUJ93_ZPchr0013g33926 [Zizania palustris]|uniref:Uncharacterized protein n=1 Tax=Zizania palustris TaxID=103762 RepID=A0A8J6BWX1_ZIZPA|nr:hypothetical protein GUJ93_ZPchr0013g33926 [Zizania palustris]
MPAPLGTWVLPASDPSRALFIARARHSHGLPKPAGRPPLHAKAKTSRVLADPPLLLRRVEAADPALLPRRRLRLWNPWMELSQLLLHLPVIRKLYKTGITNFYRKQLKKLTKE